MPKLTVKRVTFSVYWGGGFLKTFLLPEPVIEPQPRNGGPMSSLPRSSPRFPPLSPLTLALFALFCKRSR